MSKNSKALRAASLLSSSSVAVLEVPAVETVETVIVEASDIVAAETTVEVVPSDSTTAVSEVAPAVVGAVAPVRDSLGYGSGTETSYILSLLLAGTYTRASALAAFLAKFAGTDAEETKKKKTTFSVFFSDVKRPIGTYHASRGLVIVESETKVLSVSPDSLATAKRVIDAGILPALRGITRKGKPKAYAAVLVSFGLPVPSEKD